MTKSAARTLFLDVVSDLREFVGWQVLGIGNLPIVTLLGPDRGALVAAAHCSDKIADLVRNVIEGL